MGWFSNLGDGMGNSFAQLPQSWQKIFLVVFWSGMFAVFAATISGIVYDGISKFIPVTEEKLRSAERELALEKLEAETDLARTVLYAKKDAIIANENADVAAHRKAAGLPEKADGKPTDALAALAEIATNHISTILIIMIASFLLPTFSSTGEPWRLVLNIAAAATLAGIFSLIKDLSSGTIIGLKVSAVFLTVNTTSVGISLIFFGSTLAAFSLYMLHKPTVNTRKPK
jgi:hypothetical protein